MAALIVVGILVYVFALPRLILSVFDPGSPWCSYFYLYGFGLMVFLIGLWVILKSGACKPGRGRDSFWLGVLIGGFIFFAVLHAVWILLSVHLPTFGGA